jgi:hypothetical protein
MVFALSAFFTIMGVKTVNSKWEATGWALILVALPVAVGILDLICMASHEL